MADSDFGMGYALGQDSANNSGNGMFGGDGAWGWFIWIILIFAIFGWGNGGWGNNGGNSGGDGMAAFLPYIAGSVNTGGALTREQACIDNNFQNLMRETAGISDAVGLGFANLNSTICNQQYDTAQMVNAMNISNLQNFNAANVVALQNQNALQTQLAECCCDLRSGIQGINYNMATNTCALQNTIQTGFRDSIEATQAGTRAILDYLCQEKISDLQSENSDLRLKASQAAQTANIVNQLRPFPVASYQVPNPFTGSYGFQGYGYNGFGGCCGC